MRQSYPRVKRRSPPHFQFRLVHAFYALAGATVFMFTLSFYYLLSIGKIDGASNNNSAVTRKYTSIIKVRQGSDIRKGGGINSSSNTISKKSNEKNNASPTKTNPKATIGYAISLTSCGGDDDALTDGGAVLKHSIHLSSVHNPNSKSKYSYKMYAIVHPAAESCSKKLAALGYTILLKDTPVQVKDIQAKDLRENVEKNGCCGEKEFIKLWAYTLTEHPAVVHLDLDTLILQPLDDLFDAMLDKDNSGLLKDRTVMFGKQLPPSDEINAYFTRDYNMAQPTKKHKLVQGGFLILRPSQASFEEFQNIITTDKYFKGSGWGGAGFSGYGAMTFQGIIPYYYDILHPNTGVELNRCWYNAMVDNPRDKPTTDGEHAVGDCRDGRADCEDCRNEPLEHVNTVHFTLCQKPWNCLPQDTDRIQHRLCRKFHHKWFEVRDDLENGWAKKAPTSDLTVRDGELQRDHFFGFCKNRGERGYIHMVVPSSGM